MYSCRTSQKNHKTVQNTRTSVARPTSGVSSLWDTQRDTPVHMLARPKPHDCILKIILEVVNFIVRAAGRPNMLYAPPF